MTGSRLLEIQAHDRGITCLLPLNADIMVSSSVDRKIKMWDLSTGECSNVMAEHTASVTCLAKLNRSQFVSGGNDENIYIWENNGELIRTIIRHEGDSNMNALLVVANKTIITASDSTSIIAYNADTGDIIGKENHHRESVTCLEKINETTFVSGSLDGTIALWEITDRLHIKESLSYPPRYFSESSKKFNHSVQKIVVTGSKYIAVCIANGFKLFDLDTGESVVNCPSAHRSIVHNILTLYNGKKIVTCGLDAKIKIWGSSNPNVSFSAPTSNSSKSGSKRKKVFIAEPHGDMWIHTNQVKHLLKITETMFVSAGSDGQIVIWKDGMYESVNRNEDARMFMEKENQIYRKYQNQTFFDTNSESFETAYSNFPRFDDTSDDTSNSFDIDQVYVSEYDSSGDIIEGHYLLDEANYLLNEQGKSKQEIREKFRIDGHATEVVDDILENLTEQGLYI
eukprot:TRINITY_DN1499_c0_g1_i1.p1 TRINITY_DN1499_c0_g1~~TRINITY_DN1499_c0_g1_i1.p1  ORF type:complete len:454 (-),score=98.55 TRINITY_DN1499_c0_g1_i1:32-1393(-)